MTGHRVQTAEHAPPSASTTSVPLVRAIGSNDDGAPGVINAPGPPALAARMRHRQRQPACLIGDRPEVVESVGLVHEGLGRPSEGATVARDQAPPVTVRSTLFTLLGFDLDGGTVCVGGLLHRVRGFWQICDGHSDKVRKYR